MSLKAGSTGRRTLGAPGPLQVLCRPKWAFLLTGLLLQRAHEVSTGTRDKPTLPSLAGHGSNGDLEVFPQSPNSEPPEHLQVLTP